MYTIFLAGGIASGKSTVALHMVQAAHASRIDLDQLSRTVLSPGSPALSPIAAAFGQDLLSSQGILNRSLLAERAFASAEATRQLEALELPYIIQAMQDELTHLQASNGLCVVDVPLLNRLESYFGLADEIVAVVCAREQRKEQAISRGMSAADFDARDAQQPSQAYLIEHAHTVIRNDAGYNELIQATDMWLQERGFV